MFRWLSGLFERFRRRRAGAEQQVMVPVVPRDTASSQSELVVVEESLPRALSPAGVLRDTDHQGILAWLQSGPRQPVRFESEWSTRVQRYVLDRAEAQELGRWAAECALDGWSQIGESRAVNQRLCECIMRFQVNRTLLHPRDGLPAAWGALGWQSVGMFHNLLCLLRTGEGKDESVSLLRRWLARVPEGCAGWGDLIVFHEFAERVSAIGGAVRKRRDDVERLITEEKEGGRRAHPLQLEAIALDRALTQLNDLGSAWIQASPLTLSAAWNSEVRPSTHPQSSNPARRNAVITLLSQPGAASMAHWYLRRLADSLAASPAAIEAVRWFWMDELRREPRARYSDSECREGFALIQFYSLWAGFVDWPWNVAAGGQVPLRELENLELLFEPWRWLRRLSHALDDVSAVGALPGELLKRYDVCRERHGAKLGEYCMRWTRLCRLPLTVPALLTFDGSSLGEEGRWSLNLSAARVDELPDWMELLAMYDAWAALMPSREELEKSGLTDAACSACQLFLVPWRALRGLRAEGGQSPRLRVLPQGFEALELELAGWSAARFSKVDALFEFLSDPKSMQKVSRGGDA